MSEYEVMDESFDQAMDLSDFDDAFAEAETQERQELPDGKYQVRVESVKLDMNDKGTRMLKWDFVVVSGPHAGRHIFKTVVISQGSLPYIKQDLQVAGLQLAKFSELAGRLETLLDLYFEVTKRVRGEFTNVYINRRLELADSGVANSGNMEATPF